jgi:hypothetical protein
MSQENPTIEEILDSDDIELQRALFAFTCAETDEEILLKFGLWARHLFPKFFTSEDAPFHKDFDRDLLSLYRGRYRTVLEAIFRGSAKTSRAKLFIAFCMANDTEHKCRYFKILTKDLANAKAFCTDVYNFFMDAKVKKLYPEIFQKTDTKREETMSGFTTATGISLTADTVGTDQRGQVKEAARPDFIIFDDFETRKTLYSAQETMKIYDNIDEALTGLSKDGVGLFLCNYISERGNVHRIIRKQDNRNLVRIIPIEDKHGNPTWPQKYTKEDIAHLRKEAEDFEGEYQNHPSASLDVLFDRERLDRMEPRTPVKEIAGFKIYREYDSSHRYGSGHDVAGGVGLDSSTSVFIDFDLNPAEVVATYANNEIHPDVFGDEIARQGQRFGENLVAPERNKYDMVVLRLRQIYPTDRIFKTSKESVKIAHSIETEYGWLTTALSKPKMLYELAKAVDDGLLLLNDPALIEEAKSYTRDDLMDRSMMDPRLMTRHFDLLTALAIAWQLRNYVESAKDHTEDARRIIQNREARIAGRRDVGL